MFLGKYYHTLEEKGRVSLPKVFRDQTQNWVITRGLDGCLFLFEATQFATELTKLGERTFTKKAHRDVTRLLAHEAVAVSADANGRIHLPEYLINQANLVKDVVVAGNYNRIEIWDRERYHEYLAQLETKAEEIAEHVEN